MSVTAPQQHQPKGYGQASTIYRKAGWLGVLPLDPGTKWPPPKGYTGRDGNYPDGRQIFEWATQRALHGLALRLPRGVVGVDVDEYDSKHGARTLADLEARYGPLPATWSSTSRGADQPSRIHLYRCPEDLILPGAPGPAIEFIQHHHRYTVAWPTVVDGRQYRWYDPDGRPMSRPPRLNELAWLPEDWHRIQKPRVTITDYQPRAISGDWSTAVGLYHTQGVDGLREAGGRHDAMLPVVLSLVRADERGHPGAAEALADLHGRFVVAVGDRSSAKDAELEWARMEAGAAALVASTPAQRPTHEELRQQSPQRAQEPPSQPIGDFEGDDEAQEADGVPLHGWEAVDLAPVHDGTFERPRPSLLRRKS